MSLRGGNKLDSDFGTPPAKESDKRRLANDALDVIPWKSLEVALTDLCNPLAKSHLEPQIETDK